jgi:hypothetical protein
MSSSLKIAIAQIAPVWLDKAQTTLKIISQINAAGAKDCELVVWRRAAAGLSLLDRAHRWRPLQLRYTKKNLLLHQIHESIVMACPIVFFIIYFFSINGGKFAIGC